MKLITYFRRVLGPLTFVSDLLTGYMRRRMIWSPWGTVRLHKILSSDSGRDLHDHPWDFTSLILTSGYYEHQPGKPVRFYSPFSLVTHQAEDLHRLEIYKGPVYTLVLTGPVRRNWGFRKSDGTWIGHDEYDGVSMAKRAQPGDES